MFNCRMKENELDRMLMFHSECGHFGVPYGKSTTSSYVCYVIIIIYTEAKSKKIKDKTKQNTIYSK